MPAPSRLEAMLASFPSVLVGYSGGVDSALVAVAARHVRGREHSLAALGLSPSVSTAQRGQARAIARQFDLNLVEIATDELQDPGYIANQPSRCYFCKQVLWARLTALAGEWHIAVVVDGTNADDGTDHRPGHAAGTAHAVRSPLAELGYTKADVRREARTRGIPIWDAPAAPCLSSRIMYGLPVTIERLRQVEEGETLLRALGVSGDLRVRHRGDEARIEVAPSQFDRVRSHRDGIGRHLLGLGFGRVTLDLRGYRRGSLLTGESDDLELLAEQGAGC